MRLYVGTSGYAYDQWDGTFYPAGLPATERLAFYAARIGTVEINNTFHRMPRREVLRRWASAVPEGFQFVIKAPRRITHEGRLTDEGDALGILLRQLEALGDRRGPILFQTPPYLPARPERLRALLARLPPGVRAAFELRHASWSDPAVDAVLAEAGQARCTAEHAATEDETPLEATASWGYVRLRAPTYDDAELRRWAERIRDTWDEAYVFFKHEDGAPRLVERMTAVARALPGIELR
ncbi:MAG: DUF72 domain-containing protein [Myxococcales bacterium]|nr:DUF72 domain-containing protein [Myxococcales bacterium]